MRILTLKQVADLLKVHPNTVRTHAMRGTIPAAKVGRDWRFVEEDLVAWIRARYPEGCSGGPHAPTQQMIARSVQRADMAIADPQLATERALDALLAKPTRKRSRGTQQDV